MIAATVLTGVFLVLSTMIPVLLSNRKTRVEAREAAAQGSPAVMAALHRLEGKVDTVRENVGTLLDWKAVHESEHLVSSRPSLAVASRRARR